MTELNEDAKSLVKRVVESQQCLMDRLREKGLPLGVSRLKALLFHDNLTTIEYVYDDSREHETHIFFNEALNHYYGEIISIHGSVDKYCAIAKNDPFQELLDVAECSL